MLVTPEQYLSRTNAANPAVAASSTPATNTASSGAVDTSSSDVLNLLKQYLSQPAVTAKPNYPAGIWDVTSPDVFIQRAITELTPYYTQLLKEADGDVNLAKQRLEEDWLRGVRIAKEDLEATLGKLGITFTKEADTLRDNLNKRGIAVTQGGPGVTAGLNVGLKYAGEGQPATELAQLNEDQKIRKEAEDRTAQRALETAGVTKQRGVEDVTRQDQLYRQELQRQKEQQAVSRASVYSSAEQAQKSAQIAKAQAEAQYPSTDTTSAPANVSSNWLDYYKGWDPNVARGDFQAVYGGDLSKLQRSKPL